MKSLRALVFVLVLVSPVSSAHSRTWYVTADGTGDVPTIQAALNAAVPGDDVLLAPGTYTWTNQNASGSSMITMKPGICLHSEAGPGVTVLDAETQGRVILCDGVDDQTTIEGLTITGGRLSGPGAGIDCENASPQIVGNVIHDNHSGDYYSHSGGGIGCGSDSSPLITDNVISSNSACFFGGGISCVGTGTATIARNTIRNNNAYVCPWLRLNQLGSSRWQGPTRTRSLTWSDGGGILCWGQSSPLIESNLIEENWADFGAGISCESQDAWIESNVFRLNTGRTGVAVYISESAAILNNTIVDNIISVVAFDGAMLHLEQSDNVIIWNNIICQSRHEYEPNAGAALWCNSYSYLDVKCNLLWDNDGGDGNCDPLDASNIHLDPLFCDAEAADYTLQEGSPCSSTNPANPCGTLIGALGVACETVAVEPTTWGRVKALYRR